MRRTDVVLLVLTAIAFVPAWLELASVWASVDYLSHGFLIPVVAGFVAVARRREWKALPPRRDARGAALVMLALVLASLGLLAGHPTTVGVAVVMAAFGAVWAARGGAGVELMRFPLAYLAFMIPPPPAWTDPLILRLQLWVSAAAVEILRAFGLAILRDGNVMVLPGGTSLFVDEACSGITSVWTLIPLGVLLAWTTERTRLRRFIVIAWIIPAALLGNLLRVVVTVWASARIGVDLATADFLHEWAGVGTYVLACGLLLAVSALLHRLDR